MLAIGLACVLAGRSLGGAAHGHAQPAASGGAGTPAPPAPPGPAVPPSQPLPAAGGGRQVLTQAPAATNQIALTVDDGYRDGVVAGYVDFAIRTGIHLTFCPNGLYAHAWAPHADQLKPLIERGQVQIVNHTFNHPDLRTLTDPQIRVELERNDEWVQKVFGISTKPYYRPPYGLHNEHVDGVADDLGYRNTVLWSGTLGDWKQITPESLLAHARQDLRPGVIMLGHANHPTVLGLFDQITDLIRQRDLNPVTLHEMFAAG
jgi:peptidoglycan/xylan/chitin deacetylase (PgdA/CDA1 family)